MIAFLQMKEEQVCEKYWRITDGQVQMKIRDGHCIFYNDGCTVHPGRPKRCAQWPLHPAILSDENNYRIIADSCPGIKKELSYQEFRTILQEFIVQTNNTKDAK